MRRSFILFLTLFSFISIICRAQYTPAKVDISQQITVIDGVTFYVHKVEKRQTLFSISRTYNVSNDVLIKDNPGLEHGLKEGDTILIRKGKAENVSAERTTPKDTVTVRIQAEHTVRWYENLQSIARKYGVTEADIAAANSLKDQKIQTRQVLKIPYPGEAEIIASGAKSEPQAVSVTETVTETADKDKIPERKRGAGGNYSASLIIPLGGRDSASAENLSGSFVEFYQGFLIALEDLKNEFSNINFDLRVFDSDRIAPSETASAGYLDGSDIIIGPVFSSQIEPILSYAFRKGIPLVSPVDPSGDNFSEKYPNYFHVGTPVSYQQRALIESISPEENIVLIFEEGGQDGQFVQLTRQMLQDAGLNYKTLSYNILSGRSIYPRFAERLVEGRANQIVVASNSEAFVSDVLRNLNLLKSRSGHEIKLFGTPRWRNFDNVDINLYHGMNLNISLPYYVDYGSEDVKRFIARFRELYRAEPTAYSFQAYDVAYFFLGALFSYGGDFEEYVEKYNRKLLQSDYKFIRRNIDEGFINSGVRLLKYRPDFSTDTGTPGR